MLGMAQELNGAFQMDEYVFVGGIDGIRPGIYRWVDATSYSVYLTQGTADQRIDITAFYLAFKAGKIVKATERATPPALARALGGAVRSFRI